MHYAANVIKINIFFRLIILHLRHWRRFLFYDRPIRRNLNVSKIKKTNKQINKNKNISFRFSGIERSFTALLMRAEHNTCKSLVTYADYIMFFVVCRLRFLFTFPYVEVTLSQYYMYNVDLDYRISVLSVLDKRRSDYLLHCTMLMNAIHRLYSFCFPLSISTCILKIEIVFENGEYTSWKRIKCLEIE